MPLSSLIHVSLSRLLPGCCALCGGDGPGALCARCSERLLMNDAPRCERCALRLTVTATGGLCAHCTLQPPAFDRTLALADYTPPLDRLLLDLKFRARLPLADALGSLLACCVAGHMLTREAAALCASSCTSSCASSFVLLPVPLSAERLAERGFNQAHELARPLAKMLRLKISTGDCVRVRHTEAQASLPMAERQVNMRSAFAVLQRQAIAGKSVLVIDDVMTTGQTLASLAACLKRHGATHVTNLVIARTPAR